MARMLLALLCLGATTIATPVLADGPPRIFVASTGIDSNDGSRGSPKRSFQAAHDAAAAGTTIVALDTAGYGALSITKSLSIVAPPGVSAFIPVPKTGSGIGINAPDAEVSLRNLIVEGSSTNIGILAESVRRLIIEDTSVQHVGAGIYFVATSSASLVVQRSSIRDASEGIIVTAAKPNIVVSGVISDTTILDSFNNAVRSWLQPEYAPGSTVKTLISRCILSNGYYVGISSDGGDVVLDGSTITNFQYASEITGGSKIYTRGNNTIYNNKDSGYPLTPLAPQ